MKPHVARLGQRGLLEGALASSHGQKQAEAQWFVGNVHGVPNVENSIERKNKLEQPCRNYLLNVVCNIPYTCSLFIMKYTNNEGYTKSIKSLISNTWIFPSFLYLHILNAHI